MSRVLFTFHLPSGVDLRVYADSNGDVKEAVSFPFSWLFREKSLRFGDKLIQAFSGED